MSHNKRKLHQKWSKTCYEGAFLQASNLILEIERKHFVPPFCSCHRLLCNTTNTSEPNKRTQLGNLLPLLPPHTPDPACKPNVEDYFWFCFGNIDNFDVGKLGAFGTVLPPQRVLGLQPLITAGNSFFFAPINFSADTFGIFLPLFSTEDAFRRPLMIY